MKGDILAILTRAVRACREEGLLSAHDFPPITLEIPKEEEHGDYSTTFALGLAPVEKKPPKKIAEDIVSHIQDSTGYIQTVEVAGPGFINISLKRSYWYAYATEALRRGHGYGDSSLGMGRKVLLEFVSANPTGPLHVGHGRGAAVGESLSMILKASGYNVIKEYYVNDIGKQIVSLGRSVFQKYVQLLGRKVELESAEYRGEYIQRIAREIIDQEGERYVEGLANSDSGKTLGYFSSLASEKILEGIKKDLADFGIRFDTWSSEKDLRPRLGTVLDTLKERGDLYEKDGALWFSSTKYGDDKDRVLKRDNGEPTYFLSDIAYHSDKFKRNHDVLINIWGADHHGYLPRVKAALTALGFPVDSLHVLFVQMVSLLRGGQPVAMSKREGEYVTLREVIQEVGSDASKFFFLMRRCDSHLDFDLELAKQQTAENPVYYVQYAHARISSIFEIARERGVSVPEDFRALEILREPEEVGLLKHIAHFPDIVEGSAGSFEPHRITFFLITLAGDFHKYYNEHRVLSDDPDITSARLLLVKAVQIVLKKGLELMGISAPEKM